MKPMFHYLNPVQYAICLFHLFSLHPMAPITGQLTLFLLPANFKPSGCLVG